MENLKYPYLVRLPKYLCRAIKDIRKQTKMTQSYLADVTGTSVKFISEVERGKERTQTDKVFTLLRALVIKVYLTIESQNIKS